MSGRSAIAGAATAAVAAVAAASAPVAAVAAGKAVSGQVDDQTMMVGEKWYHQGHLKEPCARPRHWYWTLVGSLGASGLEFAYSCCNLDFFLGGAEG